MPCSGVQIAVKRSYLPTPVVIGTKAWSPHNSNNVLQIRALNGGIRYQEPQLRLQNVDSEIYNLLVQLWGNELSSLNVYFQLSIVKEGTIILCDLVCVLPESQVGLLFNFHSGEKMAS